MDETTAIIQRGCRLARELEENLDNLANQPGEISRSCDEIIRVFSHVKERISYSTTMVHGVSHDQQSQSQIQEWLRSGGPSTQAMDHLLRVQAQYLGSRGSAFGLHGAGGVVPEPTNIEGKMKEIDQHHETATAGLVEMRGRDADQASIRFREDHHVQPMEVSNASRGSSSTQRQRRRRDEGEKRTVRVPAPRMGNTEIPPEDHYTWRKYGQKDILNSNFPRSYFRCTHQKLYKCPAKKQVQRLDDDPDMFEVTYRGEHTCHLSSTAPSMPPPSLQLRQDIIPQAPAILQPPPSLAGQSSSVPSSHWLSMDIIRPQITGDQGTSSISAGMQMFRDISLATAGPSNNSSAGAGSSSAVVRFGEYQPVTDLADVMFNSGSSSNNSMDFIFPSMDMDDKWDSGEKKI